MESEFVISAALMISLSRWRSVHQATTELFPATDNPKSAVFSPINHPYIYRAVFVDGRVHAPDL